MQSKSNATLEDTLECFQRAIEEQDLQKLLEMISKLQRPVDSPLGCN